MFKMRCRVCGSTHTKKNGVRKGVQLYKCCLSTTEADD